jgi:hypothetical protein
MSINFYQTTGATTQRAPIFSINLDLVGVQEVRGDKGGTELADNYTFLFKIIRQKEAG